MKERIRKQSGGWFHTSNQKTLYLEELPETSLNREPFTVDEDWQSSIDELIDSGNNSELTNPPKQVLHAAANEARKLLAKQPNITELRAKELGLSAVVARKKMKLTPEQAQRALCLGRAIPSLFLSPETLVEL